MIKEKDGIYKVFDHYEVYAHNAFIASADTYVDARLEYYDYTGIRL